MRLAIITTAGQGIIGLDQQPFEQCKIGFRAVDRYSERGDGGGTGEGAIS